MPEDVTELLDAWTEGNPEAKQRIFPIVYKELKELAHRQLGRERPDHTLNTTGLVHEAYLKLAQLDSIDWQDREHFFSAAAGTMRRILIDYATMRNAKKRGGGARAIPLFEGLPIGDEDAAHLLELDQALRRLERHAPRQVRVTECRFFAGLTIEETAETLGVSPITVRRDWNTARAWLNRELNA